MSSGVLIPRRQTDVAIKRDALKKEKASIQDLLFLYILIRSAKPQYDATLICNSTSLVRGCFFSGGGANRSANTLLPLHAIG